MGTTRRPSGADRTGATEQAATPTPRRPGEPPEQPTPGHGLLWGAVFTLAPYLLGLVGVMVWALLRDTGPAWLCANLGDDLAGQCSAFDSALFLAAASAPYSALGTGAAWVLVLAMQYGPAKRWRGVVQGLLAAAVVYAIAVIAVLILR